MTSFISGNGLGLFNTSAYINGANGNPQTGRSGQSDRAYVNVKTGNLVLQREDEHLVTKGDDLSLMRTYNSLGARNDDNGDNWRLGVHRSLFGLTGVAGTNPSTITKRFDDGAEVVYTYNGTTRRYENDSAGADIVDWISYASETWTYTDGASRATEQYDTNGRLTLTKNADGQEMAYTYAADRITITDSGSSTSQVTELFYAAGTGAGVKNLTKIKVTVGGVVQTRTYYIYDARDRLTEVKIDMTPADGVIDDGNVYKTVYAYSTATADSRLITSVTNGDGTTVSFEYYPDGKVKSMTDAGGTTNFEYTTGGTATMPATVPADQTVLTAPGAAAWSVAGADASLLETNNTDDVTGVKTVFDRRGNGVAIWAQGSSLYMRTYNKANNTWSAAVSIGAGTGAASGLQLSMSPDGRNVIAAWVESHNIYSMRWINGGTGTRTLMETDAYASSTGAFDAMNPTCAIADNGKAVVSWVQASGSGTIVNNLLAKVFDGVTWSSASGLDDLGSANANSIASGDVPSLGMDPSGNVVVLWLQKLGAQTVSSLCMARYDVATKQWSTPSTLESDDSNAASAPLVAFDARGNGFAAWVQDGAIRVRHFSQVSGTWSSFETRSTGSATVSGTPTLAMAPGGNAVLAWKQGDDIMVSFFIASSGSWSAAAIVDSQATPAASPAASINDAGEAVVVYCQAADGATSIGNVYARRYVNGAASGAAVLIESNANSMGDAANDTPSVAMTDVGDITVLWRQKRLSSDGFSSLYKATWNGDRTRSYTVDASHLTWAAVATHVYGDASIATALQAYMGGFTLVEGMRLTLPEVFDYTKSVSVNTTTITSSSGYATKYTSNSAGQLLEVSNGGGTVTSAYVYDNVGNVVQMKDGNGNIKYFKYNAKRLLTETRDAAGNVEQFTYDSATDLLLCRTQYLVADPDGANARAASGIVRSRYAYDDKRHLRFEISPEGRVTEYQYGNAGNRTASIKYIADKYVASNYALNDLTGWVTTTVGADLSAKVERVDYQYDFRGNLKKMSTYLSYNADGTGNADGGAVQYVYSQDGHLLQTLDGRSTATASTGADKTLANATTYTYDSLGRLLTSSQWVKNGEVLSSATYTYNDSQNTVVVQMANGLTNTTVYDSRGLQVSVQQQEGSNDFGTVYSKYDSDGRLRITIDALGRRSFLFYDTVGRILAKIGPDGAAEEYRYDNANRLIQTTRRATPVTGQSMQTLYDGSNNPTSATYDSVAPAGSSGSDRISRNIYDAAGRLVLAMTPGDTVDQAYVTQYVYDGLDRLVDKIAYANPVRMSSFSLTAKLADVLRTVVLSPEDRHTRTFYDQDGRIIGSLDGDGYLSENVYNAGGELVHTVRYAKAVSMPVRERGSFSALKSNAGSNANDQHSYFYYDGVGRLAGTVVQANGSQYFLTTQAYDKAGNVTERVAYSTAVAWTASKTLAQLLPTAAINDAATVSEYDGANRLLKVTTKARDGDSGVTNVAVTITSYVYNNAGQVTEVNRGASSSDVRTSKSVYNARGQVLRSISAIGVAKLAAMPSGATAAEIEAVAKENSVNYTYDKAGQLTSMTDQYNNRTVYYYDDAGRLVWTVDQLGQLRETRYNAFGQAVHNVIYNKALPSNVDLSALGGGSITTALANTFGAVADPAKDSDRAINYTMRGAIKEALDANGKTTSFTYNAFGEVVKQVDPISTSVSTTRSISYDHRGLQLKSVTDLGGLNLTTSQVRDAFGRVTQSTDANGNNRSFSYDKRGNTVTITDPAGSSQITYDAFSRVLTSTDARSKVTTTTYQDAKGLGSFTVTTPENITVTTTTNVHGETVKVVDGNNVVTEYGYDKNGNNTTVTRDTGTGKLNLLSTTNYDRTNRKSSFVDANNVTTTYEYDKANRLFKVIVDPDGLELTTVYEYDGQSRVYSVTDPNGKVTRTEYDPKGQVKSVTRDYGNDNLRTEFTYDDSGHQLTVTMGVGGDSSTTQYTYDKAGRLTDKTIDPSGLNLTESYTYDGNGNVTKKTDANGKITYYRYDGNDRLTYVVDPQNGLVAYEYDEVGHITKTTRYAQALTGLSADPTTSAIATAATTARDSARDLVEMTVYNDDGKAIFGISAAGTVTEHKFDNAGRVVKTILYANRITIPGTLNVANVRTAVATAGTDAANDRVQRVVYDNVGRALYTVNAKGDVVANQYDAFGHVTQTIRYANSIVASAYIVPPEATTWNAIADALYGAHDSDLLTRLQAATGLSSSSVPAANSKIDVTKLPAVLVGGGVSRALKTSVLTDTADVGAALVVDAAKDQKTLYTYDSAGRLVHTIRVINSQGEVTENQFDSNGNRVKRTSYFNRIAIPGTVTVDNVRSAITTAKTSISRDVSERTVFDGANRARYSIDAAGATVQTVYNGRDEVVTRTAFSSTISASAYVVPTEGATWNSIADSLYGSHDAAILTAIRDKTGLPASQAPTGGSKIDVNKLPPSVTVGAVVYDLKTSALTDTTDISDVKLALQSVASTSKDQVSMFVRDKAGRERFTIVALGDQWEVTEKQYDSVGNAIKTIRYATRYTGSGNPTVSSMNTAVASLSDLALDQIERISYDGNNRMRTVSNALGEVRAFERDALGNVIKSIQYANLVPRYYKVTSANWTDIAAALYGSSVSVNSVRQALGGSLSASPPAVNTIFNLTDLPAKIDGYKLKASALSDVADVAGALSADAAKDRITHTAFNNEGRVVYTVNVVDSTKGEVSRIDYNAAGEWIKQYAYSVRITVPTTVSKSSIATAITSTDSGKDQVVQVLRDNAGQVIYRAETRTSAQAAVTQFTYDSKGNVIKRTVFGNLVTMPSSLTVAELSAAIVGNIETDQWTRSEYDAHNRVVATGNAAGEAVLNVVDGLGNVIKTTHVAARFEPSAYVVKRGASWQSIAKDLYGVNSAAAGTELARVNGGAGVPAEGAKLNSSALPPVLTVSATSYKLNTAVLTDTTNIAGAVTLNAAKDRVEHYLFDNRGMLSWQLRATSATEAAAISFQYDGKGNLLRTTRYAKAMVLPSTLNAQTLGAALVTDADNDQFTHTTYDAANRAIYIHDASGKVIKNVYRGNGDLQSTTAYDKALAANLAMDADVASLIVANGSKDEETTELRDAAGRLVERTDALGVQTRTTYDTLGRRKTVTAAAGTGRARAETYGYDQVGRRTSITNALNETSSFAYDAFGNQTRSTGGNYAWLTTMGGPGYTSDAAIAIRKRLLGPAANDAARDRINGTAALLDSEKATILAATSKTYTYNNANLLEEVTDANGVRTAYSYNTAGQLTQTIAARYLTEQTTTTNVFDRAGRLVKVTDPMGFETSYSYDALGNRSQIVDANGNVRTNTFNLAGDVLTTVYGGSVAANKDLKTVYTVDLFGRIITATEQYANGDDASTVTYGYDRRGNVTSVTDGEGFTTTNTYDLFNNLTKTVAGQYLVANTAPEFVQAKLNASNATGGTQTTNFIYDQNNQMLFMFISTGDIKITGGKGEWATTGTGEAIVTQYEYDELGNKTKFIEAALSDDARSTIITYDSANRVSTVTSAVSGLVTYTYDPSGRKTSQTTLQDAARSVSSVITYEYDNIGNLTSQIDGEGYRTAFEYDARGNQTWRITAAGTGLERSTRSTYDLNNRKTADLYAVGSQTSVGSDEKNAPPARVQYEEGTFYFYDKLGNRIRVRDANNNSVRFYYDKTNRLCTTMAPDGAISTIEYNRHGDKVSERSLLTRYTTRPLPGDIDTVEPAYASLIDDSKDIIVKRSFDKAGHVVSVTEAAGGNRAIRTDFVVNGLGRKTEETRFANLAQALRQKTEYLYDFAGRLVKQKTPDGTESRFAYDKANNRTIATVIKGSEIRQTRYTYTLTNLKASEALWSASGVDSGHVLSGTGAGAPTLVTASTIKYDAAGNAIEKTALVDGSITDGVLSGVTRKITYTYDANNRVHTEKLGNSSEIIYTYDAAGNLKEVDDARGNWTTFKYDANNLRISQESAGVDTYRLNADGTAVSASGVHPTTTNEYDKVGNLVCVTDANNNKTYYFYDENHHLTGKLTADKALTLYENDAVGRKVRETVYMAFMRDPVVLGKLPTAPIDPNARETTYAYDQAGHLTKTTLPAEKMSIVIGGNTATPSLYTPETAVSLTEENVYDALGNLIESTDRAGKKILHFYDVNGRETGRVEVIRDLNFATQADAIAAQTTPVVLGGYVTLFDRDQQGNVIKQYVYSNMLTSAQVAALRADPRPSAPRTPSGNPAITNYYYNAASQLLQKVEPAFNALSGSGLSTVSVRKRTSYFYDQSGQAYKMVSETVNAGNDSFGAAALSDTSSTQYIVHDAQGRETATISSRGAVTRYSYDGNGNQTRATSYFGVVSNPGTSLKKQMTDAELTTLVDGLTGRDSSKDKRMVREFDAMNRLTLQWEEMDEYSAHRLVQRYRYDANGNRTYLEDEVGNVTKSGYDVRDRLVQLEANGSVSVAEYDAVGKPTLMYLGQTRTAVPTPTFSGNAKLSGNKLQVSWSTTGGSRSRVLYSWEEFGYPVGDRRFREPVYESPQQFRISESGTSETENVLLDVDRAGHVGQTLYMMVVVDDGAGNEAWTTLNTYKVPQAITAQTVEKSGSNWVITTTFDAAVTTPKLTGTGHAAKTMDSVPYTTSTYSVTLTSAEVGGDPAAYFYQLSWTDGSGSTQTTQSISLARNAAPIGVSSVVTQTAVSSGFQAEIVTTVPATLPAGYGANLRVLEATWRPLGSSATPTSVACATTLPLSGTAASYTLNLGGGSPLTSGTQYEVVLNAVLLDGTRVVVDTFTLTANGTAVSQRSVGWNVPLSSIGQSVGDGQMVVVAGKPVSATRQGTRLLLDTLAPGDTSAKKFEAVYGTLNTGRNHTMNVSFTGTGPYNATVSGSIAGDRTSVSTGSLRLARRLAGSNDAFTAVSPTTFNTSNGDYSFSLTGVAAGNYEYKLYYVDTGTPAREVIVEWQPVTANTPASFGGTSSLTVLAREQGQVTVDSNGAYTVTSPILTGSVDASMLMQDVTGTVRSSNGTPGNSNANGTVTGYFTSYSYDKLGRVIATNEGDGQYKRLDLDAAGNVVRTSNYGLGVDGASYEGHASWSITTFKAYDDRGRVVAEFLAPNANNVRPVTRYKYDAFGNLVGKQTPEASSWNYTYTYSASGTLLTATDPMGGVATNYLDARGNVTASSTPRNTAIISKIALGQFDPNTSVVVGATNNPLDYVKRNIFSADGLLLWTIDEMGNATGMTYDCQGRMVTKTTALGVNMTDRNQPTYLDFAGRATNTPTRNTTWFAYDNRDRLVAMTTPHFIHAAYDNSEAYQFVRESLGLSNNKNLTTDPLSPNQVRALKELATVRYSYDGRNNRIKTSVHTELKVSEDSAQKIDEFSDLWTEQSYDAVGHVIDTVQKRADDGDVNIGNRNETKRHARMRYDVYGNLVWQTNGNGDSRHWTYGGFGQMKTFTDEDGWVTTYDDTDSNHVGRHDGLVRHETGANEKTQINGVAVTHKDISRTYDDNGLLLTIVDNSDVGLFDQNGSIPYNHVKTTYTYTIDGKRWTETIDAVERVKSRNNGTEEWSTINHHRKITYSYDNNRRLTKSSDESNENYGHYGNVTGGSGTWASRASGVPINTDYDSNGNVIARYTDLNWKPTTANDSRYLDRKYLFDRADHLIKETAADGTVSDNSTYDGAGNRATRTVNGVLSTYTYDAANRLVKTVSAGLITRYFYDTRGNLEKTTVDNATGTTVNENSTPITHTRKSEVRTTYDAGGRPLKTTSTTYTIVTRVQSGSGTTYHLAQSETSTTDRTYDKAGNLITVTTSGASGSNSITQTYDRFKDGRERSVSAAGRNQEGNSVSVYDANHHLTEVRGDLQDRRFVYDNEGNVLYAAYEAEGSMLGSDVEYMYALGNSIGEMGVRSDGTHIAVFDSQAVADANNPRSYSLHNNSTPEANGIVSVTTQSGDTCRSLARNYYRDESKWYLIAERNGLSGDNIATGTLITIGDWDRAGVPGPGSHAATPESGIFGSSSPSLHYTGAAPTSQCAQIAMIVVVVAVAVVAAVATAGIGGAIVGAAGTAGASTAAVGGVVVGSTVTAMTAGTALATVGIYAAVGAVVSVAASMVRQGLEKGLFNYEEEGGFWHNVLVDGAVGGVAGGFIGGGEAIRLAEAATIAGKAGQAFEGGWSSVLSVGSIGRGALDAGSVVAQTALRNAMNGGADAAYDPVATASAFFGGTLNNAMAVESAYMSSMSKQINRGVDGLESAYEGAGHAFSVLRSANAVSKVLTPWASVAQSYLREGPHLDWAGAMSATVGEAASFVTTGMEQSETAARLYGLAASVASGDPQTIGRSVGSFAGYGMVELGRSLSAPARRSEFDVPLNGSMLDAEEQFIADHPIDTHLIARINPNFGWGGADLRLADNTMWSFGLYPIAGVSDVLGWAPVMSDAGGQFLSDMPAAPGFTGTAKTYPAAALMGRKLSHDEILHGLRESVDNPPAWAVEASGPGVAGPAPYTTQDYLAEMANLYGWKLEGDHIVAPNGLTPETAAIHYNRGGGIPVEVPGESMNLNYIDPQDLSLALAGKTTRLHSTVGLDMTLDNMALYVHGGMSARPDGKGGLLLGDRFDFDYHTAADYPEQSWYERTKRNVANFIADELYRLGDPKATVANAFRPGTGFDIRFAGSTQVPDSVVRLPLEVPSNFGVTDYSFAPQYNLTQGLRNIEKGEAVHEDSAAGMLEGVPFPDSVLTPFGTEEQTQFKRDVYNAHVGSNLARHKKFFMGLNPEQTGRVEGKTIRKDAVPYAVALLEAVRTDLKAAQEAGDPAALAVKSIGIGSSYRDANTELKIWQQCFEQYYNETASDRQAQPDGEHGPGAIKVMVKHFYGTIDKNGKTKGGKAAPGFGNHTKGTAMDFITTQEFNGQAVSLSATHTPLWQKSWLYDYLEVRQNAARYNFKKLDTEAWHFDYMPPSQ